MVTTNILFALILTSFAGLSTGIGSAIAFFAKKTNTKFLSTALGFSAGVMIYVSFVEIFPQARDLLIKSGTATPVLTTVIAFFVGIAIIYMIDMLIPNAENPHEMHMVEDMGGQREKQLKRMGLMMALAIGIHNFPEGMATFTSALVSPDIAIPIAIAIAIHNIPEGIAVSVPIYYATGNRKKAFWLSLASGMAEPIGGLIGYFILMPFMSDFTLGLLMASVAGIMVFISVDELLPGAEKYGEHHFSIAGFVAGMAVMAISLLML
ncbi:MAG: zinc transporter ZupT [Bacteroidales bacterium]|nr:zinc transporter ZupT [Bacteroidales bacterium]